MTPPSLRSEFHGNVLTLTLDTPGAEVNVLTREAAACLVEALDRGVGARARAVVFRSGKKGSFVNGVGLMLAGAIGMAEDAQTLTGPVRAAYRALRTCEVPTIAAIEGNCYGCGVELALQCRYRVAADTFDTHFRMTELADYLFLPTFGGTQDLPRLLGLERAADFVLWGERLTAALARDVGLVDDCFDPGEFDRRLVNFVDRLSVPERKWSPPGEDALRVRRKNRLRIERLPPAYRSVYSAGLDLMEGAAGKPDAVAADYEREAQESARSIVAPPCRGAWPFFFIRQMARTLAIVGAASPPSGLAFKATEGALPELAVTLTHRCAGFGGGDGVERVSLIPYGEQRPSTERERAVAVSLGLSAAPFEVTSGGVLYAPLLHIGIEVAEMAFAAPSPPPAQHLVSAALARSAGFTVLETRPKRLLVLDELIAAWIAPQLAYLASGGKAADLACSLRTFGFTRFAGDSLDGLGRVGVCRLVRERMPQLGDPSPLLDVLPAASAADGVPDDVAVDALVVSLGGFAARMLRAGCVQHPAVIDVAAREVVDFPLQYTSLCRHFTLAVAHRLLRRETAIAHLVAEEDIASLKEFVGHGREYYLALRRK